MGDRELRHRLAEAAARIMPCLEARDWPALERVAAEIRGIVRGLPAGHPLEVIAQTEYCRASIIFYRNHGGAEHLDEAVAAGTRALGLLPADYPDHARQETTLGNILHDVYRRSGDPDDLDRAARHLGAALADFPAGHPDRQVPLTSLARVLADRYALDGDPGCLRASIAVHREVAGMFPDEISWIRGFRATLLASVDRGLDEPGELAEIRAVCEEAVRLAGTADDLAWLAWSSGIRYQRDGDLDVLRRAVAEFRDCAAVTGSDDPRLEDRLAEFALFAAALHLYTGDESALTESIATYRRLVKLVPGNPHYLVALGNRLCDRFGSRPDSQDVEEALSVSRAAVAALPEDSYALHALGRCLYAKGVSAQPAELMAELMAEAADHLRRSTAMLPGDAPDLTERLGTFAGALTQLHKLTGDTAVLDEAIVLWRQVAEAPGGDTDLHFEVFGHLLQTRYASRANQDDLTESVSLDRRLAERHPGDAHRLGRLGNGLATLDAYTRDVATADEAIALCEAALAAPGATERLRADCRHAIGLATYTRGVLTGSAGQVAEGIEAFRAAGDPHGLLTTALDQLHKMTASPGFPGGRTDAELNEAITLRRRALKELGPDHPERPEHAHDPSTSLLKRWMSSGDSKDLDETADYSLYAAKYTRRDHPRYAEISQHASLVHATRAHVTKDPTDALFAQILNRPAGSENPRPMDALRSDMLHLMQAPASPENITTHRAALRADLPESLDTLRRLCLLGNLLAQLPEHLAEAVDLYTEALAHPLLIEPLRAGVLAARGPLLHKLGRHPEALADLRAAVDAEATPPMQRIAFANDLAAVAAETGGWAEAARAHRLAVRLIPQVAARELERPDQQARLAATFGMVGDAAAALNQGDPGLALELLEQGRGVLLSQILDDRHDLAEVRRAAPDLADRLLRLREELSSDQDTDTRHAAAAAWTQTIEEVHALRGLDRFLAPPRLDDL